MSADSPTPILSPEKWDATMIAMVTAPYPATRAASEIRLRTHDRALRDAVAVLTEERDAWMELCGQVQEWYTAYRRRNPEGRVAVLEAGLRRIRDASDYTTAHALRSIAAPEPRGGGPEHFVDALVPPEQQRREDDEGVGEDFGG